QHATGFWESTHRTTASAVVLLQPTSPLRTAGDIDGCIDRFCETNAEICASVVRPHDSPYFNMVEADPRARPFVPACSPHMHRYARRQDAPVVYALNGAVYVIGRSTLARIENQFRLRRFAVYEMPTRRSVDIDDAEHLALAECLLSQDAERGAGLPA